MSDGAAQNGGTQAATTGEAASAAAAAVAATAASAAPAATNGAAAAPAAPLPAGAVPSPIAPVAPAAVAPAAVAIAQPAAQAADCVPAKPKKAHKHDKKDGDEEHARAPGNDEDQNLSQPADGCVLPQTGQAAEGAAVQDVATTPVSDGEGGGISSGLLIGAGVLAAVGVGVLALSNDKEKNGNPVANADTGAVNEGATLSGSVATNDTDPNNDTLTFALTGTAPAGLTFNSNGTYTFDANNAAYNALAAGATQTITVPYTVSDGRGGSASSTLTITITGTNDAPTATAVTGPAATEGGAAVTATVVGVDPDQGAVLTYSLVNPVAGVTINATTGVVTLNPADPAYNSLRAGQVQQVVANVRVADAQGASATTTVTFAVTGTNDAPVAVAQTGPAATEGGAAVTGTFVATDPEGDALTFALVEPVAGLTINATTGAFTLDPTNPAFTNLAAGETRTVVANVRVTDALGASTTQTLTFVVTGIDNGPVVITQSLDVDNDANPTTRFTLPVAASTGTFAYTDDVNVANNVLINGFGGDDTITFNASLNEVSFGSGDFDNDGFADDLRITVNRNGTVSDIILLNSVANDALVFNEASAEAAIGAGFDNFIFSGAVVTPPPPPPPVGATDVSLDVDTDNNLNTARVFDAANGAFRFTDDADVANNVVILNLGTDDRIILEAGNTYSFANGARDGDNIANDLIVTINKAGQVSQIVIKDVVDPTALVFNEATAEQALGGIDYFQFA